MLEVICNKAKTCKIENCGMKKPHWHFGCKCCHFDSTAKCVSVNSITNDDMGMVKSFLWGKKKIKTFFGTPLETFTKEELIDIIQYMFHKKEPKNDRIKML